MIVARLMGGLGNQMFQYAAGRALALRHRTVLKLDLSFFETTSPGNTARKFLLDRFPIVAERASTSDFPCLEDTSPSLVTRAGNAWLRMTGRQCRSVLLDFDHSIKHSFFLAPDQSYLVGYWQSEAYFHNIRDSLLHEFIIDTDDTEMNAKTARLIGTTCSVAIHFRRGDYVEAGESASYHGLCSLEYYQRATEIMAKAVHDPHFFIFSDDPGWVRGNFDIPYPCTLVDHNRPDEPVGDLGLMSLCKHQIIANSTFSWWGAWLNTNPGKNIIAPKRWFACDNIQPGLIPGAWIQL